MAQMPQVRRLRLQLPALPSACSKTCLIKRDHRCDHELRSDVQQISWSAVSCS